MRIRRKGPEWFSVTVDGSMYPARADYGCPGQWTAVAFDPTSDRPKVIAVSASPYRGPTLRQLQDRLHELRAGGPIRGGARAEVPAP
jgi:hypothetical protein